MKAIRLAASVPMGAMLLLLATTVAFGDWGIAVPGDYESYDEPASPFGSQGSGPGTTTHDYYFVFVWDDVQTSYVAGGYTKNGAFPQGQLQVYDKNGTVGPWKSFPFEEFSSQDGAGLLHERIVVGSAFEDAGFATARTVADGAVRDLLEQQPAVGQGILLADAA